MTEEQPHSAPGTSDDADELVPPSYNERVGLRLRAIRRQKRLSLQDVEQLSGKEFKASVLGAYERGERAISVPRLQRLAQFYDVPVDQLLPQDGEDGRRPVELPERGSIAIDLHRLAELSEPEMEVLERYLHMIQMLRQDFNGRVLTIRREDLRALAFMFEISTEELAARLEELGLRAGTSLS